MGPLTIDVFFTTKIIGNVKPCQIIFLFRIKSITRKEQNPGLSLFC